VNSGIAGKSQVEVYSIFEITRQALDKWNNKHRVEGAKSLKA